MQREGNDMAFQRMCALSVLLVFSGSTLADFLDGFLFDTRPLLLFSDTASDPIYEQQLKLLSGDDCGLFKRNVTVINVVENEVNTIDGYTLSPGQSAKFRDQYQADGYKRLIVLVGKDGEVKLRAHMPLSSHDLFKLIDLMPTRRAEAAYQKTNACTAT